MSGAFERMRWKEKNLCPGIKALSVHASATFVASSSDLQYVQTESAMISMKRNQRETKIKSLGSMENKI